MLFYIKKIHITFHYYIVNQIIGLLHIVLFKKIKKTEEIKKILIFRTGSIGDNICALPAIFTVKKNFINAQIDILTNTSEKNLLSIDKLIDRKIYHRIINYENISKKELGKELKKEHYDLFVEFTQVDSYPSRLIRNMLIIKLLNIKHAFRWYYSISYVFPKFQEKYFQFPRETERLLANLKKEGLEIDYINYPYAINEKIEKKIAAFLLENKIQRLAIGIAIGSKLERNKWNIQNFGKLAEYFIKKGFQILIFGGKEDEVQANLLENSPNLFNLCGKFSPLESIQLMKACKLVISNDTGPLHMAYSVGTPTIGLYSSREYPGKWFPPENKLNFAFRTSDIDCSICWQKGVNKKCESNICMQRISVEEVITKANEILNL